MLLSVVGEKERNSPINWAAITSVFFNFFFNLGGQQKLKKAYPYKMPMG
jgi:hypothetical protein